MKHFKFLFFCTIQILLLLPCLNLQAQVDNSTKKLNSLESRIDRIFTQFDDSNKPGASVAVVKNGAIVFKKGYGSANLEYNIPNTPSTIFHIASISKQFTVFSILLLADQGKLTLDDDIRTYIPEVPNFGKTITLRHLATHTSGLRDQWSLLAMSGTRLDDVITKEHVLKLVANQKELNFEPGEAYLYCNTGFTLLAEVVSRVSGQSFAEFTKSHIFEPLKMSNTLFYDDHEKIVKNRAYSYYSDKNEYKKKVLSYANVGATSLFTTVEDLSLWALNFATPKVGDIDLINQMNTLAILNNGQTFGGAYGQFVSKYKGLNQIQHGGADAGYRSYLGRFPDQGFSIIVLSNYAQSRAGSLALKVADLFLQEEMIPALPYDEKKGKKFKKLKNKKLKRFSGNYWNHKGFYSRKIYVKNDTLRYSRGTGNESSLAPINNNTFQMLDAGIDLKTKFEYINKKQVMTVTVNDVDPDVFESYTPVNYSKEELTQFTGTFYSEELSTSYTFIVKDGKLIAEHARSSDISMAPIKQDMFSGTSWFFRNIKFERDTKNNITGIRVSSSRVKNLYFKKLTKQ